MRLIDAEALKKALKEKFDDFIPEGVYDEIDNAPTVELDECVIQKVLNKRCMTVVTNEYLISLITSNGKRPKGEWKYIHDTFSKRICNRCNYSQVIVDGMADNFCPNCGADMRKESRNEI